MSEFDDRIPPQSLEMEQAVLGAVLQDPEMFDVVADILRVEDFYHPTHQVYFECYQALKRRNDPIDMMTVPQYLKDQNVLDLIGGPTYINQLWNALAAPSNAGYYAKIVAEKATLRRLTEAARKVNALAHSEFDSLTDVTAECERLILAASDRRTTSELCEPIADVADRALIEMKKRAEGGSLITGLTTGLEEVDIITCGLQPAELVVIGARPSHGKTSLGLQFVDHISDHHGAVALFSFEMKKIALFYRIMSMRMGLTAQAIRSGYMSDDQWVQYHREAAKVKALPIKLADNPAITVADVRSGARRMKRDLGIVCVMVDYLQIMKTTARHKDRYLEVGAISRELQEMAMELDIPVLALAQIGRQAVGRYPEIEDFRESGNIDNDVRTAIMIHRPNAPKQGDADRPEYEDCELYIAKNNSGEKSVSALVRWHGKTSHFVPRETEVPPMPDEPVTSYAVVKVPVAPQVVLTYEQSRICDKCGERIPDTATNGNGYTLLPGGRMVCRGCPDDLVGGFMDGYEGNGK